MGAIPTIEIRCPLTPIPFGSILDEPVIGDSVPLADGWDAGIFSVTELCDLYEDGAPLADGRVFQCPGIIERSLVSPTPQAPYLDALIMGTGSRQIANVPVVFVNDATMMTCFYIDPASSSPTLNIACFRGYFKLHVTATPLFGSVPMFLESAQCIGSILAPFASDVYAPWSLGGRAGASGYGDNDAVPRPFMQSLTTDPTASEFNERLFMGRTGVTPGDPMHASRSASPDGFGAGVHCPIAVNNSINRAFVPSNTTDYPVNVSCYRRTSSHATLTWSGLWPTAYS